MITDIDIIKQQHISEKLFKYLEDSIKDIKLIKVFPLGDPEDYWAALEIELRGIFEYKETLFNITLVYNIKTKLYYYYIEVKGINEVNECVFHINRYNEEYLNDLRSRLLNTIQLIIKIINNEGQF